MRYGEGEKKILSKKCKVIYELNFLISYCETFFIVIEDGIRRKCNQYTVYEWDSKKLHNAIKHEKK